MAFRWYGLAFGRTKCSPLHCTQLCDILRRSCTVSRARQLTLCLWHYSFNNICLKPSYIAWRLCTSCVISHFSNFFGCVCGGFNSVDLCKCMRQWIWHLPPSICLARVVVSASWTDAGYSPPNEETAEQLMWKLIFRILVYILYELCMIRMLMLAGGPTAGGASSTAWY